MGVVSDMTIKVESRRAENCGGLCSYSLWLTEGFFLGRTPCTQVHGLGSPAIWAGRGGGDAGSLLPGVLPPELVASRHLAGQTPSWHDPGQTWRVLNHLNHIHHTHHGLVENGLAKNGLEGCTFFLKDEVGSPSSYCER